MLTRAPITSPRPAATGRGGFYCALFTHCVDRSLYVHNLCQPETSLTIIIDLIPDKFIKTQILGAPGIPSFLYMLCQDWLFWYQNPNPLAMNCQTMEQVWTMNT